MTLNSIGDLFIPLNDICDVMVINSVYQCKAKGQRSNVPSSHGRGKMVGLHLHVKPGTLALTLNSIGDLLYCEPEPKTWSVEAPDKVAVQLCCLYDL